MPEMWWTIYCKTPLIVFMHFSGLVSLDTIGKMTNAGLNVYKLYFHTAISI